MDWVITIKCSHCSRTGQKYLHTKYGQKTAKVGCNGCNRSTDVDLKDHKTVVGGLTIDIWHPCYDS